MNQPATKPEAVLKADWFTTAGMAFLLAISLLFAAADFRHALRGQITQVSIYTLVFAGYAFMLAYSSYFGRWGRGGFILLGLGGCIRAAMFYLNAPTSAQHSAAIFALVLGVLGWTMIFISAVQWFRTITRVHRS